MAGGATGGMRMGFEKPSPTVIKIIVVACAVFLLEVISVNFLGQRFLVDFFALTPAVVIHRGFLWQPFTYILLHDPTSFLHIAFNMLMLWWFASPMERSWGTRRFLKLFFGSALIAGAAVMLIGALLFPLDLAIPTFSRAHWMGPTFGMSGVVLAFLAAYALENKDRTIMFMFVVPMRAITLIYLTLGIEGVLILTGEAASWPAHFGGIAAGALWVMMPRWALIDRLRLWRLKRKRARSGVATPGLYVIDGGADEPDPKDRGYLN